jgi:hypothetical protein
VIYENSLINVIREQHKLARYSNIPLSDSDRIPEFEREAYIGFLNSDLKKEKDE